MMPNVRLKPDSMVVNLCGGVWCVSSRNLHNYYFCISQYDDGVRFNTGPQMTDWISVGIYNGFDIFILCLLSENYYF